MSPRLGLAALGVALTGCDAPERPPPDLDHSPSRSAPRLEVDAKTPTGSENPQQFTRSPFIALTTIDRYPPPPNRPWPPRSSKEGATHGMIWDAPMFVGPHAYWHASPTGWITQPRELDPPSSPTHPVPAERSLGRPLGIVGDQLLMARASADPHDATVEILAALVDDLSHPWQLCTLRWPAWALHGELSPWYQYAGPALVGEELVMLGEGGLLRAAALDCASRFFPTAHEPRALTPGRERVAWRRQANGHGYWSIASADFSRMIHLPYSGLADWAGDSLILEDQGRLLRWTEDALVELELPGPMGPTRERRWLADGAVLWIYEPGQPLWRFDGEGFVSFALALEWPSAARAQAGVLIWSIARPEGMEVLSTWPGAGLGLDR